MIDVRTTGLVTSRTNMGASGSYIPGVGEGVALFTAGMGVSMVVHMIRKKEVYK